MEEKKKDTYRLDHSLGRILDSHTIAVGYTPTGYKVIIVGYERADLPATQEPDVLVKISLEEVMVLQDFGENGTRAGRNHEDARIDAGRCCDFEVVPLQINATETRRMCKLMASQEGYLIPLSDRKAKIV